MSMEIDGYLTGEQAYHYLDTLSKKIDTISCSKEGEHYTIQLRNHDNPEAIKMKNFIVQHFQETIEDRTYLGISKFTYKHEISVEGQNLDGKQFTIKTRLYSDEGVFDCDMVSLQWE